MSAAARCGLAILSATADVALWAEVRSLRSVCGRVFSGNPRQFHRVAAHDDQDR